MLGLNLALTKLTGLIGFAASATPPNPCNLSHPLFFVVPPWWEYLKGTKDALGQCTPYFNFPDDILPVGLAVLDILLRLAGLLAVISIIIAGVEYITATGNTEKITSARRRWINALTGLGIALAATAFVSFVGRKIVG